MPQPPLEALLERALANRAELQATRARQNAAKAEREASSAEAQIPEVMVGLGYWQMPNMRPGIGATVGMTLPWLWGGQRDRLQAAQEQELAAAYDHEAARVMIQAEVTETYAQLEALTAELGVLEEQSLPAASRALDAVRSAYTTGNATLVAWMEAAQTQLALQLEQTQLRADHARASAALERVVGTPLTAKTSPASIAQAAP
jgi:cobalt-zinc-cadmium efflux system outer membrane protein